MLHHNLVALLVTTLVGTAAVNGIVGASLYSEDFALPESVAFWTASGSQAQALQWDGAIGDPVPGALRVPPRTTADSPCFAFESKLSWILTVNVLQESGARCQVGYRIFDTATCTNELLRWEPPSTAPVDWASTVSDVFLGAHLEAYGPKGMKVLLRQIGGAGASSRVFDQLVVSPRGASPIPLLGLEGLVGLALLLGLFGLGVLRQAKPIK